MIRFRRVLCAELVLACGMVAGFGLFRPEGWQFICALSACVYFFVAHRLFRISPLIVRQRRQRLSCRLMVETMMLAAGIVGVFNFEAEWGPRWVYWIIFVIFGLWAGFIGVRWGGFQPIDMGLAAPANGIFPIPDAAEFPSLDAEEKAQTLFRRLLDPQQRAEYDRWGCVSVPLPDGQVARIGFSGVDRPGMIAWPDGIFQCVGPSMRHYGSIPRTDVLIAQLLYLRANPVGVRRVSGIPPYRPRR